MEILSFHRQVKYYAIVIFNMDDLRLIHIYHQVVTLNTAMYDLPIAYSRNVSQIKLKVLNC